MKAIYQKGILEKEDNSCYLLTNGYSIIYYHVPHCGYFCAQYRANTKLAHIKAPVLPNNHYQFEH